LFLLFFFWFGSWEIHSVDSLSRTNGYALTAETALVEVDVRNIVLNGDGTERTLLLALATTNTSSLTSLHGYGTLVLVDAGYIHLATLRALLTKLDDVTRTSLHTGTARRTLLLIDLGQTGLRIHVESVKLTSSYAIATSQTTESASRLTSAA
jgi:hypothetical protein